MTVIRNSFYNACLLTKDCEKQLSRVGIYNNIVPVGDAFSQFRAGNLESDFWEFQEFDKNQPKVMPIKVIKKTKYTGSKRKTIKEIVIKVKNSSMYYSLHSLQRYRERSWGHQEIKIDDFFSIDERWVKKLSDAGFGFTGSISDGWRQDLLFPFGEGAFLGNICCSRDCPKDETYTTSFHKGKVTHTPSFGEMEDIRSFTCRTYVGREDFTWFQEEIYRQYHSNDLDNAVEIVKNNRMKEEHWMYKLNLPH